MGNFFKDNDDLQFYVDHWIDWPTLARVTERGFTDDEGFSNADEAIEFYREILEMFGQFAADEVAPHAADIEHEGMTLEDGEVTFGPKMQRVFDQIGELGLHAMNLPRELGGMNVPLMVYMLNAEMFARADVGMMTHHSFHGGMAMAALVYSIFEGSTKMDAAGRITETRFRDMIDEIATGQAWGAMDITEPHAGSDMAALRTKAELGDDGVWYLTGTKIFITSGHAKYHFVVAKTDPSPDAGLEGLSFFLVRAYEDQPDGSRKRLAHVVRLEEKLGHHSSATCQIEFDRTPGELIGNLGEGFKQMLLLMNNARVGVAMEGLGIAECAYRMARDYAAERGSMGKTIDQHEMIADYLDEMRTDIQGLRALVIHGAYNEELSQKTRIAKENPQAGVGIDDAERARHERNFGRYKHEARRVTPLMKYYAAEKAVEIAQRCIQIHGGAGYTKEYGAEKLLRDAMVLPIYEGTSQIQSLMAMKDALMAIMKNPQGFLKDLATARWRSMSARDPLERRVARLQWMTGRAQQHLMTKTAADKFGTIRHRPMTEWTEAFTANWDPKRDFAWAMLHAERLILLMIDSTVADLLFEQAKRYPERREVLNRWLERAEPRSRYRLEEITHTGGRILDSLRGASARAAAE